MNIDIKGHSGCNIDIIEEAVNSGIKDILIIIQYYNITLL